VAIPGAAKQPPCLRGRQAALEGALYFKTSSSAIDVTRDERRDLDLLAIEIGSAFPAASSADSDSAADCRSRNAQMLERQIL